MSFQKMRAITSGLTPLSQLSSTREVIRQFTPNWFAMTMGTGVLALALAQFPGPLVQVGYYIWLLNIMLFATFSVLYAARWIMFFDQASQVFGHSVVSMFFGCIPMGLATIINGFLVFGLPLMGGIAVEIATTLWWIDVAMSVICGIAIPYLMFTRQTHSIDQMTAVWLLPMVAAEVAAASGGLLAPHMADPHAQLVVLITSYVLWALSVPIALSVIVVLVLRLAIHKLPHISMASTSWLALGPIGTGALGLMTLGQDAPAIFSINDLGQLGAVASGLGVIGGLLLWGYGLWWFSIATLVTLRYSREGLPFNLGWWGYTFPLGVYSLATLKLGTLLPLNIITLFGTGLVVVLIIVWMIVAARTVCGAWRGNLFVAPCLART